ncbi:hypothetical protein WS71_16705 [Burkholderia mayonis]|uniref:Uncharacterized protein n=1 Tax=Burkholderia mayonis TaxID=1385591 RepID=A0A1B4FZD0_9BURK|nr:hypothetical protein WS71_16705 [Burkholderia mayonis]KVE55895.1 hypothetical protein WS71_29795 [Burkholderia mayonis]
MTAGCPPTMQMPPTNTAASSQGNACATGPIRPTAIAAHAKHANSTRAKPCRSMNQPSDSVPITPPVCSTVPPTTAVPLA